MGIFYWAYRQRGGRVPIVLGGLFSASLLLVAVYPDVLEGLAGLFTRLEKPFSRLVVPLTLSVIILSVLLLRLLFQTDFHERSLRELVFRLGLREFEDRADPDDIRPVQVVIPALNEAENLRRLLPRIPDRVHGRPVGVLVVSDGSQDETARVAREHSHLGVENLINLGQGTALRLGFEICRRHGAEIVVAMDADGQHDPGEIPGVAGPVLEGEADLVVGSRQLGEDRQKAVLRRVGVRVFNWILSLLLRRRVTDCSNGFRAFRVELLQHIEYEEPQYFEPEFLIQALARDIDYREVPVTVNPRWEGSTRMPSNVRYGWGFLGVILRSWWRS